MENKSKKREEKQALKEEQKQELPEEELDDLDYSSNEEEQLDKKKSLQRVEPKLPRTFEEKQTSPRLIVILEFA